MNVMYVQDDHVLSSLDGSVQEHRPLFASSAAQIYRLSTAKMTTLDEYPPVPPFYKQLAVAHFKLRDISCSTRFVDFQSYLTAFPFRVDICGVSESWPDIHSESTYTLQGYKQINVSRTKRKGGGVIMYINDEFEITKEFKYSNGDESTQLVACQIKKIAAEFLVITCYNASGSLTDFLVAIETASKHFM